MSKERAAKVMQEIFSKGTYEGDLLGIHEGRKMSYTPRTDVAQHNMGSVVEPHYVVDVEVAQGLERELAKARDQRDKAVAVVKTIRKCLVAGAVTPSEKAMAAMIAIQIDNLMQECGK